MWKRGDAMSCGYGCIDFFPGAGVIVILSLIIRKMKVSEAELRK